MTASPRHGGSAAAARSAGQGLVEFALTASLFLLLLLAVIDLGMGIYQYNGVAQAAREIARTTSVHTGAALGTADEVRQTIATQKRLIPHLGDPSFTCVDIAGATVAGSCNPGDFVTVTIAAPYTPTPWLAAFMGLAGGQTFVLRSSSTVEIQ